MNPSNIELAMLVMLSFSGLWLAVKVLLLACKDSTKHLDGSFSTEWGKR